MRTLSTVKSSKKASILGTAVVALTMTTMYAMPTAYASGSSSVQGVSFVSQTQSGAATAQWGVGFTTSSSGGLAQDQGTITITAPTGTVFQNSPSDYLVNGQAAQVVSANANVVTITVPQTINASEDVGVTVENVQNPAAGDWPNYDFTVSTSADTIAATPPWDEQFYQSYPQASRIGVGIGPNTAGSTAGWEYDFMASNVADLQAGIGTITFNAPPGTKFSSNPADYQLIYNTKALSFTQSQVSVGPNGNSVTVTVPTTITAAAGLAMNISNVINPPVGVYPASDLSIVTSADLTPGDASTGLTIEPSVTINSVLVNGQPASSSLEATAENSDLLGGVLTLDMWDRANPDDGLTAIGITPNDTIEVKLTVGANYTPVTSNTLGNMISWSATPQSNGTTLIDVKGNPTATSWASLGDTVAYADYPSELEFNLNDLSSLKSQLGNSFSTDVSHVQNTFVSSNAQVIGLPTYDASTNTIDFSLTGPHYESDGKTVNQGWFNTFIPDNVLSSAWGITDPSSVTTGSLIATMDDSSAGSSTVTPQVTQVDGGIMLGYSGFNYSTENISIKPNPMSPPTSLAHQGVTQTGWTESWQPVSGAATYNVYINGTKVANVTGTSYPVTNQSAGQTYSVTVRALDSNGVETGLSGTDSVQTSVPATTTPTTTATQTSSGTSTSGSTSSSSSTTSTSSSSTDTSGGDFSTVVKSYQFDSTGGNIADTSNNSNLSLFVPPGAFKSPVQVKLTAGLLSHLGAPIPAGQKAVAAFGVNFPANVIPSKPITFTIENPSIAAGGAVYKVSGGKLIPVSGATVTDGKAVITFTSDPDFVVLAPETKTVLGATSPETGRPFNRTALEGGIITIAGGALLLVTRRKKQQQ